MKKLLLLLIFLPIAGGVAWYENQPTTAKAPVVIEEEPIAGPAYEEPVTTTSTTAPKPPPLIDFSKVRLHLEVQGVDGDNVSLVQMIHDPQELSHIPHAIQDVMQSCGTITDRDRVVRVDTKIELTSNMPAKVNVNYQTMSQLAVFDLSDGPICKSGGHVTHSLTPGEANVFSYWVLISGFITPESPNGDYSKSWYTGGPILTLPNMELMHWKLWGSNVAKCNGVLGETARITLAGRFTGALEGCQPAVSEDQATGG